MTNAEIANIVGWEYWLDEDSPTTEDNQIIPEEWCPTTDLNHAIQAAEMRWPRADWSFEIAWLPEGKTWECDVFAESGEYIMCGDTPCEAICRTIEASKK